MTITSESFKRSSVAIIGDVMLDIYIHGGVERISPEAPVPVIQQLSERVVPGGAANVAANVAALGASVKLVGIAGEDAEFDKLAAQLERYDRIDRSGILITRSRATTTKTRLVGHQQQIARLDRESRDPIGPSLEQKIIQCATAAIDASDLVIVSDYGKGVLSDAVLRHVLDYARQREKPVIVDPKRRDLSAYRGASLITPNRAELALATGKACETDDEIVAAAKIAQRISQADILVTRSEKGMSLVPREGEPVHLSTAAHQVFDVSGAGDTVVAVLGTALAAGHDIKEAMRAANFAAGIVVSKLGTATVSFEELANSIGVATESIDIQDGQVVSLDKLIAVRRYWQSRGLVVGLANGCFDLLHPGHVSLIRQAAEACDRLVIALNSDASVRRLKGSGRPVQTEASRADVVGAIKGVCAVTLFDQETPKALIEAIGPDVLVKGADYSNKEIVGADFVRARGGTVLLAKLAHGHSTSQTVSELLHKVTAKARL